MDGCHCETVVGYLQNLFNVEITQETELTSKDTSIFLARPVKRQPLREATRDVSGMANGTFGFKVGYHLARVVLRT